jgi:hypothetical protein
MKDGEWGTEKWEMENEELATVVTLECGSDGHAHRDRVEIAGKGTRSAWWH